MLAHSSPATHQGPADVSDGGSSSLSELEDMPDEQQELASGFGVDDIDQRDDDTEASTERVDPSPMKQRDIFGRDPVRLEQLADAAAVNRLQAIEADGDEDIQDTGEPLEESIGEPVGVFRQPTAEVLDAERLTSPGKRKRSSSLSELEDDLLDEEAPPARKRSASARDVDLGIVRQRPMEGSREAIEEEPIHVEVDPPGSDEDALGEVPIDDLNEQQTRLPAAGDESKAADEESGTDHKTLSEDRSVQQARAKADNDENAKAAADEEEAEAAARNEDELARKRAAMDDLRPIENHFAILRDKLFDDRLEELSSQIEDLRQPNPTNLEFIAKKQAVDIRRDQKVQYEETAFRYKTSTLEREAIANRAIMHSQFAQEVREIRETCLDKMNGYASQLQRERRAWKAKTDHYLYRFNPKRTQQIANQSAYNKEVSLLSGLARYQGFPAAPSLEGARMADIDDDLRRIKVSRISVRANQANPLHPHFRPPQPLSYAAQMAHDEMAGEANFLEKNPWARPVPLAAFAGQGISRPTVPPEQVTATPRPELKNGIVQTSTAPQVTPSALPEEAKSPELAKVESHDTDLAPNGTGEDNNTLLTVTDSVPSGPPNGEMHKPIPNGAFVDRSNHDTRLAPMEESARLRPPIPDRDRTMEFSPPPRMPQSVG